MQVNDFARPFANGTGRIEHGIQLEKKLFVLSHPILAILKSSVRAGADRNPGSIGTERTKRGYGGMTIVRTTTLTGSGMDSGPKKSSGNSIGLCLMLGPD
jgi:hypothetical protein